MEILHPVSVGLHHGFQLMVSPTLLENIACSDISDIRKTDSNFIIKFKNGAKAYIPLGQGSATLQYVLDNTKGKDGRKLSDNYIQLSRIVKGR
jgi:type 1 fimbria pilin